MTDRAEKIRAALREELANQHIGRGVNFWIDSPQRWCVQGVINPDKLVDAVERKLNEQPT